MKLDIILLLFLLIDIGQVQFRISATLAGVLKCAKALRSLTLVHIRLIAVY